MDLALTIRGVSKEDLIEVQSLSNYSFQNDNSFNIGLKLSILNLLGLKGSYESSKKYNLTIDSAAIVRVANLDKLNYATGSTFVWEGIKVKSISLVASQGKADTIAINVKRINKGLEIEPSQGFDNSKKILIKGVNLFAAYRLVQFSNLTTYTYNDVTISKITDYEENKRREYIKGFEIGESYTGRFFEAIGYVKQNYQDGNSFQEEQKIESIWPVRNLSNGYYSSILEIQSNKELVNRLPKKIKIKVGSSARLSLAWPPDKKDYSSEFENYVVPLSSRVEGRQLVREVLQIKDLFFFPQKSFPEVQYIESPQFIHKKYTITIVNFNDNNVPGW